MHVFMQRTHYLANDKKNLKLKSTQLTTEILMNNRTNVTLRTCLFSEQNKECLMDNKKNHRELDGPVSKGKSNANRDFLERNVG